RREWVVIAPHRDNRPWSGEVLPVGEAALPPYDPACFLCPGNARISGARNARYDDVYVFDNDHPCVGPAAPRELEPPPGIYRNLPAIGRSRIVCYTPRHDLTLARLDEAALIRLLGTLQDQCRELGAMKDTR